ncbi:hypothetical protein C8R45DRAFT_970497 [Mycena sanguinolenta]|nr:hypothetical protein C8R45DRAFT_970497 [Mycena sanguinolenta]
MWCARKMAGSGEQTEGGSKTGGVVPGRRAKGLFVCVYTWAYLAVLNVVLVPPSSERAVCVRVRVPQAVRRQADPILSSLPPSRLEQRSGRSNGTRGDAGGQMRTRNPRQRPISHRVVCTRCGIGISMFFEGELVCVQTCLHRLVCRFKGSCVIGGVYILEVIEETSQRKKKRYTQYACFRHTYSR